MKGLFLKVDREKFDLSTWQKFSFVNFQKFYRYISNISLDKIDKICDIAIKLHNLSLKKALHFYEIVYIHLDIAN